MKRAFVIAALAGACLGAPAGGAQAAIQVFQGSAGLTAFNTIAGNPPITIDLESQTGVITGQTIAGVTFTSLDGNSLEVVDGNATVTPSGFSGAPNPSTNKLFPTSGSNVLSPGGATLSPGPALSQKDSIELLFSSPIRAFGLDILFQSLDNNSGATFQVRSGSTLLKAGTISTCCAGGGAPGGSSFLGFYADTPADAFSAIRIIDGDGNAQFPDANLGYDTLRFVPFVISPPDPTPAPGVPEPSTWISLTLGLAAMGAALRSRRLRTPA